MLSLVNMSRYWRFLAMPSMCVYVCVRATERERERELRPMFGRAPLLHDGAAARKARRVLSVPVAVHPPQQHHIHSGHGRRDVVWHAGTVQRCDDAAAAAARAARGRCVCKGQVGADHREDIRAGTGRRHRTDRCVPAVFAYHTVHRAHRCYARCSPRGVMGLSPSWQSRSGRTPSMLVSGRARLGLEAFHLRRTRLAAHLRPCSHVQPTSTRISKIDGTSSRSGVVCSRPRQAQRNALTDVFLPACHTRPPNRFDFGGSSVINTNKHIRLTQDRKSQAGWLWSRLVRLT